MNASLQDVRARNLRTVALLAALFLIPLLAAFGMYYGAGWRPAQRTNHGGYTTTDIIGYLSDDPRQTQLHMVCDVGIFSRGPDGKANTYPARYSGKSHQLKIAAREIGSDKVHESTCKY